MKKKLVIGGICFLIAAGFVFFGVQFYFKTGVFKVPGKVIFADEILDSEPAKYQAVLEGVELEKDVVFSEFYGDYGSDAFVTDVLVPVADFYEPKESISAAEF